MQIKLRILLGAVLASTFVAGAAQARDFRSADVHPLDYPTVMYAKKVGEIVSQKTGGKYNIKVFGNSSLGSENDTIEQVKIGTLDMVRVSFSTFHGARAPLRSKNPLDIVRVSLPTFHPVIPETVIASLPFIYRDIDHYRKVIYGPLGDKILAAFEKEGYVGLALLESGARSFYGNKPVRTLADIKGWKIRVQPSDLMIGLVESIGANPMPIPYAEVYTALKTGLVDAAANNYPSYDTAKHFEVAPIYSETEHLMLPEVLVFSKKVWDTLSAEEQQVIRDAAKESIPYYSKLWTDKEQASKNITLKGGATYITHVKKDEFVAAVKPVWDKFATTPELKKLVQDIVNTQ